MTMTQTIPSEIDAPRVAELRRTRPDVRLLDVRMAGEFESAHIPGAYNVPLSELGEYAGEIRASVDGPVVLVCQSGARSRQAEAALRRSGMRDLQVLDGGMKAWVDSGLEVKRGRKRLPMERQVRIAAGSLAATGAVLALFLDRRWAAVPAFVGSGLVFAGVTDTCGMAMVLAKMPFNRASHHDVGATVAALKNGAHPAGPGRVS